MNATSNIEPLKFCPTITCQPDMEEGREKGPITFLRILEKAVALISMNCCETFVSLDCNFRAVVPKNEPEVCLDH